MLHWMFPPGFDSHRTYPAVAVASLLVFGWSKFSCCTFQKRFQQNQPDCADFFGFEAEWLVYVFIAGCFLVTDWLTEPVLDLAWKGLLISVANLLAAQLSSPTHTQSGKDSVDTCRHRKEMTLKDAKNQVKQWALRTARAQRCIFHVAKFKTGRLVFGSPKLSKGNMLGRDALFLSHTATIP